MGKIQQERKTDLGRKNCNTKEPYFQWINKKVKFIKMPFNVYIYVPFPEPKPTHIPIEEAKERIATIMKLTKENEES